MSKPLRVVGVDLSTKSIGLAVRDLRTNSDSTTALQYDPKKFAFHAALNNQIFEDLTPLLAETDLILVEDYALRHMGSSIRLVEVGGIFRLLVYRLTGYPPVVVHASTLKKFATPNVTKAKKDVMRVEVYKRYGKEFNTDDEMDAWIVAEIGVSLLGVPTLPLIKRQEEAIKSVWAFSHNRTVLSQYGIEL